MIEKNPQAAGSYYRQIRDFAKAAREWHQGVIWYETKPDEMFDLSLVSYRVYGRRDEFLAVMAAAGLDTLEQPLEQQRLALPNESVLYRIKRLAGFESLSEYRSNHQPTWIDI